MTTVGRGRRAPGRATVVGGRPDVAGRRRLRPTLTRWVETSGAAGGFLLGLVLRPPNTLDAVLEGTTHSRIGRVRQGETPLRDEDGTHTQRQVLFSGVQDGTRQGTTQAPVRNVDGLDTLSEEVHSFPGEKEGTVCNRIRTFPRTVLDPHTLNTPSKLEYLGTVQTHLTKIPGNKTLPYGLWTKGKGVPSKKLRFTRDDREEDPGLRSPVSVAWSGKKGVPRETQRPWSAPRGRPPPSDPRRSLKGRTYRRLPP